MNLSNDGMYRSFLKALSNKALLNHEEWQYTRRCDGDTQEDAIARLGHIQREKHSRGL